MIDRLNAALGGRYVIERELGEGGMATVYLAQDLRHDRRVAVKVLRPELAAVVGAERFLAEIRTVANLQHPHILPLFDSGDADGLLFYVMPYVDGETLRARLEREKQLGVTEALTITRKIASALEYAHGNGIIHRDIKPANVLLSAQGEPLVADFGIALAVAQAGRGRITETGLSLGTPHYMSPEQATGDRSVDRRSDVYALGCVLYEMLAGRPPFSAPTAQAVLTQILTGDPAPIRSHRRTVPSHVEAALSRALEKLPADRFPSASDFARALADESFSTGPVPILPRRRLQRTVFALLASVALLTSGGVIGWLLHSRSPQALPFHAALPPPDGLEFSWVQFAVSPDGNSVAFVAVSPDGERSIWIWDFRSGESSRLAGTEDAQLPFWSPDSRSIAFSTRRELKKLEIGIGAPTVLWEGFGDGADLWIPGGTWNEDGTILFAVTGTDGGLFRVTPGAEVTRVTNLDESTAETSHQHPRFLPDGRHFLYVARRRDPTRSMLYIGDLDSPDRRPLFNSDFNVEWTSTGHLVFHYGGTLMARPFDLDRFEPGDDAFPVGQSVRYNESNGSAGFSISRSGVLVYRTGGVVNETIRPLDIVSKEGASLSTIAGELESPDEVRVSPNGRRGAVRTGPPGEHQLSVFEIEGHGLVPLVSGGRHPVWLDDSRVTFTSTDSATDGQLMEIPTDGSILRPAPLGGLEPFLGVPLTVSPDGRRLLVSVRDSTTGEDIWIIALDGSAAPRTWLATEHDERAARSSPDGRWVAFESDRAGQRHVWVTGWSDPGYTTRVSIEPDSREPVWSREDDELYFRTFAQMLAARYSADLEIRFEPPARLFTRSRGFGSGYDVVPGGGFISSRMLGEEPDPELLVVQNWFQQLRTRERGR